MSQDRWIKHQSGILYRRIHRENEVLYQIQGLDGCIDEHDFRRYCDVNAREVPRSIRADALDHQGPLQGPGPFDNRLFSRDGDPQEDQSRRPRPGVNYEARSCDRRLVQENPASGRQGSAYHRSHGNTSTLVSRAKTTETGSVSQAPSRERDSRDLPERPIQAQSSRLSALARSFAGIRLGNYLECSYFIAANPNILARGEIDALIAEASVAEQARESAKAQTYIHQALLLRKCNEVGLENVNSFFRDLQGKDSRTKESFVTDVKKVYNTIQQRVGRISEQREGPNPESQGRKPAVIQQQIERTVSHNSHTSTQDSEENPQYRKPVALGPGGKQYYMDTNGKLLHPASSRPDSERHRSQSDPTGISGSIQPTPSETSGRGRLGAGRTRHSAVSDPAVPLPTLPEHYRYESTRIGGTAGSVETLDDRYYVRNDARKFFERGRVFALLWHESAGGGGANGRPVHTELSAPIPMKGRFGEEVYSHIRRMVVVKEGHGFCLCLPINTYNGQGVTKPGLSEADRQAHSIVYMTDTRPSCLPAEEKDLLISKAIAVEKAFHDQRLDPMSRLNFKKIYTVEHNVKVMNVGKVTKDSLPVLIGYWRKSLE